MRVSTKSMILYMPSRLRACCFDLFQRAGELGRLFIETGVDSGAAM